MNKRKLGYFSKKTLSNLFVICAGVLVFLIFNNLGDVMQFCGGILAVFSPFISGLAIAYLLNIPMRFLETHVFKKQRRKRVLSIVATYLLALLLLGLLIGLIFPQIIDSVLRLAGNVTVYLANLNNLVNTIATYLDLDHESVDFFLLSYQDIVNQAITWVGNALPDLLNFTMQIGSGVVGALTALIASIYMLAGKEKLLRQCRRVLFALVPPRHADRVMQVGRLSNSVFSGFISGKIVDSAIIGVICFVFMSIMNTLSSIFGIEAIQMPYSVLISVIVSVTNIIPFFGPFLGAIPSAMILLMVNPWSAFWFVIFIIVLQQFDGNVLGPKILGESTGLPAMWVLVAIIVGGGLFGFAGMLLGVPTTAVLYSVASDLIESRLKKRGLNHERSLRPPKNEEPASPVPPYAGNVIVDEPTPEPEPTQEAAPTSGANKGE